MAKASYVWNGTQWINFGTTGPTGSTVTLGANKITTFTAGAGTVRFT